MLFEVLRDGMNAWHREFWVSSSATCSGGHGGAAVSSADALASSSSSGVMMSEVPAAEGSPAAQELVTSAQVAQTIAAVEASLTHDSDRRVGLYVSEPFPMMLSAAEPLAVTHDMLLLYTSI